MCDSRVHQIGSVMQLVCFQATANDVLYADLSLAQENSPPARCEEESTYAQIIGVMRP